MEASPARWAISERVVLSTSCDSECGLANLGATILSWLRVKVELLVVICYPPNHT